MFRLLIYGGLAYLGYRLYKLNETSGKISYKPGKIKFNLKPPMSADVGLIINNPTNETVNISSIAGIINLNESQVGQVKTGAFVIKPGKTDINLNISLLSNAADVLLSAISTRKFPKFDLVVKTTMVGGLTDVSTYNLDISKYV